MDFFLERIGSYKILRRIGTEGTGEIYEAIQEEIQRRAAIKVLRADLLDDRRAVMRLLEEARAVNRINHRAIVSIFEHGQLEDGRPYVVMEYLQGETLRERLRRRGGPMEPKQVMRIARQVASVLAAAHANRVIHRDLKPTSIMLIPDSDAPDGERVKVLNFGIAKLDATAAASPLSGSAAMGTPTYMSPEQCRNASQASERSDIYSLGVVLYELLAGAPPFSDAGGAVAIMMAHLDRDPPPLANRAKEASAGLCALVHSMLAKSPQERPSASEVASALAKPLGSRSSSALPIQPLVTEERALPPAPTMVVSLRKQRWLARLDRLFKILPKRSLPLAAAVSIVLGLLGILGAVRELTQDAGSKVPQTRWSVLSQPAGAEICDTTGQVLGHTPWLTTQPHGRGLVTLTVRMQGYSDETIVLDRSRDIQQQVTLSALPQEPQPALAPPSAEARPLSDKVGRRHRRSGSKPGKY